MDDIQVPSLLIASYTNVIINPPPLPDLLVTLSTIQKKTTSSGKIKKKTPAGPGSTNVLLIMLIQPGPRPERFARKRGNVFFCEDNFFCRFSELWRLFRPNASGGELERTSD